MFRILAMANFNIKTSRTHVSVHVRIHWTSAVSHSKTRRRALDCLRRLRDRDRATPARTRRRLQAPASQNSVRGEEGGGNKRTMSVDHDTLCVCVCGHMCTCVCAYVCAFAMSLHV